MVDNDDLVYHLGDFALQSQKEEIISLVDRLNGNIILILGNHDRFGKQKFIDCGFVEVHNKLDIGKYILTHRPMPVNNSPLRVVRLLKWELVKAMID